MTVCWLGGVRVLALAAGLACGSAPSLAEDAPFKMPIFSAKDMVPLVHGPNWVDLDGDGHKDLVVKSRWEINGPHSASVYSFHRRLGPSDPFRYEGPDWHLVPFIEEAEKRPHGQDSIATHEGADCILRDVRLFVHRAAGITEATVVLAERDPGEGYGDERPFRFKLFKWLRAKDAGDDEIQNYVGIALRLVGVSVSKKAYCGANEAFRNEFAIPLNERNDERR